ncbi:sensor histidine kinase [Sphingobacterium spiritivorum]|uniref:sensor histidine kinase n=1 Tax=Sphingobacterium spiritivorum TaxID=258 RepID=UPI003DA23DA0
MNLRNRLAFITSLIFGVIFSVAAILIYWTFYKSSERSVFKELEKTCLITGIYYLEKDEQSGEKHNEFKIQFENLIHRSRVAIYDATGKVRFGDLMHDQNISADRLNQLKKSKKISFQSTNHFYYGMYYPDNQGDFYVFVKEQNSEFENQINRLLAIVVVVLLAAWTSIVVLAKVLSKIAYRPIKRVVEEVRNKEIATIHQPISSIDSGDELQELVDTYNALLSRVSETFAIQKNFVSYVSHEFRTPLTAISGTLEVFSQKERSPEEYQRATRIALENVDALEDILNNMLILTEARNSTDAFQQFRLDEVVWDIVSQCQEDYQAQIDVDLQVRNPDVLNVKGNEVLIQLSILNIVENAIKYSGNKPVLIRLEQVNERLNLSVIDQGIGISAHDLPLITQTFYRGKNIGATKGSGIGLSLASVIFKQHKVDFHIQSNPQGTTVELLFPGTL